MPERLVPEVRAAIQNGRQLQELVSEAGVRCVNARKRRDFETEPVEALLARAFTYDIPPMRFGPISRQERRCSLRR
jgi:hypothetical protein